MNRKAQERVGMLIEQFIDNLNRESKQLGVSERWFFNRHPNLQFSVVEKAMPGMLFYDGKQMPEGEVRKKGGQKHLDHGGVVQERPGVPPSPFAPHLRGEGHHGLRRHARSRHGAEREAHRTEGQ